MTATQPNPSTGVRGQARPIVTLRSATRTYGEGTAAVHALNQLDLEILDGQYVVLLGPSGSGKTTLLNAVGGIDTLTSGSVEVDGIRLDQVKPDGLVEYRRDHVAFIFQLYNLVPTLTALENVQLIAELTGGGEESSRAALADVGLGDLVDRFPSELSGGQQQRVAVARALAKETPIILCDEPTGALDSESGEQVLALLDSLHQDRGRTVIVVSHDETIAERAQRLIRMVDGRIVEDETKAAGRIGGDPS